MFIPNIVSTRRIGITLRHKTHELTIIITIRIIGTYRNNIMHYYVWFYICTVQLVRWARGQWAFPFYILSMGYCIDIIFYHNNPIEPVFR